MIVYDTHFNQNEWFVIGGLSLGLIVFFLLPERFPRKTTALLFLSGVYSGFFFDHTLSIEPVSFYDVNDSSRYEWMDFLSYISFGPYSYLFYYIYDTLRVRLSRAPLYILVWSIISISMELWETSLGVYHLLHGYKWIYSSIIYLFVHSSWIVLYYSVRKREGDQERYSNQ